MVPLVRPVGHLPTVPWHAKFTVTTWVYPQKQKRNGVVFEALGYSEVLNLDLV
jgi:hypothetical protein